MGELKEIPHYRVVDSCANCVYNYDVGSLVVCTKHGWYAVDKSHICDDYKGVGKCHRERLSMA